MFFLKNNFTSEIESYQIKPNYYVSKASVFSSIRHPLRAATATRHAHDIVRSVRSHNHCSSTSRLVARVIRTRKASRLHTLPS
jgi:hypothetical protein